MRLGIPFEKLGRKLISFPTRSWAIVYWLLVTSPGPCPAAESATNAWRSLATSTSLPLTLEAPASQPQDKPLPLVIYLKNLPMPRTGGESDDSILADLRVAGYLVASIDYGGNPRARVPWLNQDLAALRDLIRNGKFPAPCKLDNAHAYIVPEGCRLKRDVVFYRDPKRTLAMDIVYPSHPLRPVGAVLEFSCDNQDRLGNASLAICGDTLLDAAATEGLAVAMADHPVPAPYKGLDPMPECAWKIKAAVRTLRAEGAALGFNGRIVPVGFSRGSGMALMLATTDKRAEFEGHGEHPEVSSSVQGAVVLSGRFTYLDLLPTDAMLARYRQAWGDRETHQETWKEQGALDYLRAKTVPLFLSINSGESKDALHQMIVLRERLAALDSQATFIMEDPPRGHKVPLAPEVLNPMTAYLKARLQPERAEENSVSPQR